jgi:hypothetical protein
VRDYWKQLLDAIYYTDAGGVAAVGSVLKKLAAEPRGSSRAAFLKRNTVDAGGRSHVLGNGVLEAVENFVGGVLEAGVGLVQLAGRLGGKLAKLVAIGDVSECSKNEV